MPACVCIPWNLGRSATLAASVRTALDADEGLLDPRGIANTVRWTVPGPVFDPGSRSSRFDLLVVGAGEPAFEDGRRHIEAHLPLLDVVALLLWAPAERGAARGLQPGGGRLPPWCATCRRRSPARSVSTCPISSCQIVRRLAEELEDDGVKLDELDGVRELLLDELDYARRIPMFEGRRPFYGSFSMPPGMSITTASGLADLVSLDGLPR